MLSSSSTPPSLPLQNSTSPSSHLKQLQAHFIKTQNPLSTLSLTQSQIPSFTTSLCNSSLKHLSQTTNSPLHVILMFHQMLSHNIFPDPFTLSFVLRACGCLNDVWSGKVVHGFIQKLGFGSDLYLNNVMVNFYALCGEMDCALLLFDKMPRRDVVTWNIVMTQLLKRGDVEGAFEFFSRMPEKNVKSWTLMISGCVKCGKAKEGIDLFMKMEEEGFRANEVTVVCVLAACADLGALDVGKRVHEFLEESGFKRNVLVCNTLIDMYVKCGCLEDARRVFDEMEERTVVSWSAMIAGLAMYGQAEEALLLFSKMIQAGMRPNEVTFLGILHACSHMGLVDDGRNFFVSMTNDYGIIPQIEHYGCMVDLFSRAGLLLEAHEFIINMPIKPNSVVWGALLGGCKVYKNVKLAEEATKHLSELDPLNDGYYVVLSNIYAEADRWEDAARVRMLMKGRGVKKTPGWSSITVNGVVHEFVAGDDTHPQAQEIFQTWEKLLVDLKLRGYVPKTSVILLDIEEKEKEKFLFRHSEKLAVAFGLMNTPAGTTVRIMKNLRVCEDCHSALKLISSIANREIVVRDRNRFHCFKEGYCSCRDFW